MFVTKQLERKLAFIAGLLLVITYLTSIPPFLYHYAPIVNDPGYILGAGADTRVIWGAVLELLLIISNVASAVVLFPILKRVSEIAALGWVTARIIESAFIAVGILSLLTVVTLRQDAAVTGMSTGADAGALLAVGQALVALHQWTFALGPGFVVGIGNGMLLSYLLYRSRLVPRRLAMVGVVAGPMLCTYAIGAMLGIFEAGSVWQVIGTSAEFVWELSLGIWLMVKGFSATPAAAAAPAAVPARTVTLDLAGAAA